MQLSRVFTWRKAAILAVVGILLLGTIALLHLYGRQSLIAEIEDYGGAVVVDTGEIFYCGVGSAPLPPPSYWEIVAERFSQWQRKGRIQSVKLPASWTADKVAQLSLLSDTSILELSEADDDLLIKLPTFPQLHTFKIHSSRATDAGLVCLARMPKLEWLELRGRGFTDSAALVAHPHLMYVDASETGLSESALAALITCPRIRSVSAERNKLTGCDLFDIEIPEQPSKSLHVGDNPLLDKALARLYIAPGVLYLNASGCRHGPSTVAALAANRHRTLVILDRIETDYAGLVDALAEMTQVKTLSLCEAALTEAQLGRLLRMPNLSKLDLSGSNVTLEMRDNVIQQLDAEFDDFRHGQVLVTGLISEIATPYSESELSGPE